MILEQKLIKVHVFKISVKCASLFFIVISVTTKFTCISLSEDTCEQDITELILDDDDNEDNGILDTVE